MGEHSFLSFCIVPCSTRANTASREPNIPLYCPPSRAVNTWDCHIWIRERDWRVHCILTTVCVVNRMTEPITVFLFICTVLDVLASDLPPTFPICNVPTCEPVVPPTTPSHTPVGGGTACSSTARPNKHCSTGGSVSGMSPRQFIQVCT